VTQSSKLRREQLPTPCTCPGAVKTKTNVVEDNEFVGI
jgi:hypothetical protein